ncbi:MAG: TlpA disulfide reductase family protein [Bacteroidales bacterium]|nr:TlpA disulfide reductase family protein [Bacteroidales bacterium]
MRKVFYLLIIAISITSCNSNKNSFELSGKIENSAGEMLVLKEMRTNSLEAVDSVKIGESGDFLLKSEIETPNFYILEKDPNNYITLILSPGENVKINADGSSMMTDYEIKGSKDSELLKDYTSKLLSVIEDLGNLSQIYRDSVQSANIQTIMQDLDKQSEELGNDMRDFTISFIDDNPESLASLMALYQQLAPRQYILDPLTDIDYYEKVDKSLYSLYPESEPVITLHSHVTDLKERKKAEEMSGAGINQGDVPPEISLPTPDGETLSLSSTRGKVVLLDFWAAWCSPCRQENPNLVSNYNKYKDKGFDIFQVSLDKDKASWVKGIEEDKLGAWKHVSDLKYWQSSVVPLYNIQSIPANYLLDKEGKVIGVNLRGPALGAKLEEVFAE